MPERFLPSVPERDSHREGVLRHLEKMNQRNISVLRTVRKVRVKTASGGYQDVLVVDTFVIVEPAKPKIDGAKLPKMFRRSDGRNHRKGGNS
jgi:hypothetical protein